MQIQITPIGKNAKINRAAWHSAFGDVLRGVEKEGSKLFKQSFSGFKNHGVSYNKRGDVFPDSSGNVHLEFGVLEPTDANKVYSYVNWGTAPRILLAKSPRGMRFRAFYAPATTRGSLKGGTWRKFGPMQIRYIVRHPGISPRLFNHVIHMMLEEYVKRETFSIVGRYKGKFWRK